MQLPEISQILQIVDPVDEIVTEHETPQFLVLFEGSDFPDALVGELDFVHSAAVLLASWLYNRFPIHFEYIMQQSFLNTGNGINQLNGSTHESSEQITIIC